MKLSSKSIAFILALFAATSLQASIVPPSSLSGYVYHDANNNGVKDPGETGIATTVTLTGEDFFGDAVSLTTTSDATTGAYSFTDLFPGTYTITETQPAGYLDGKDTIGTPGGTTTKFSSSMRTLRLTAVSTISMHLWDILVHFWDIGGNRMNLAGQVDWYRDQAGTEVAEQFLNAV